MMEPVLVCNFLASSLILVISSFTCSFNLVAGDFSGSDGNDVFRFSGVLYHAYQRSDSPENFYAKKTHFDRTHYQCELIAWKSTEDGHFNRSSRPKNDCIKQKNQSFMMWKRIQRAKFIFLSISFQIIHLLSKSYIKTWHVIRSLINLMDPAFPFHL